jgi:hypothetical protein
VYAGSFVRQVLRDISCHSCKTCLTSQVLVQTNVFIYCRKFSDAEQSVNYPDKVAETARTAVNLIEATMAAVVHLNSLE